MNTDFAGIMKNLMKEMASSFVDLGPLESSELDEWTVLNNEFDELENKGKELKARGELFWAKLERKYGKMGKNLKIDGDHLWMRNEPTIKELQDPEQTFSDPSDI